MKNLTGPPATRTSGTSSVSGLAPVSGSFNSDDELSAETYDQNGNVLSSGGKTFAYDAENHLISMGSTVAVVYDGDGNRVSKTVSGVTTKYLLDDLNPTGYAQVVDELTSGAVTRTYTYGLQRISQDQVISSTWTPSFYGYDGMGSVRQLTNAAGAVTDTYDYDAFGNEFTVTGGSSTPNDFFYRGEQFDPDLGLYYLRARYYNPLTGRFMSRDPLDGKLPDPKSLHKYLYVGGDPINWIDPRGREDEEEYSLFQMAGATAAIIGIEVAFTLETLELEGRFDPPPGTAPQPHPAPGNCPSCGEPGMPPTGSPYPPGQKPPITPDPGTWREEW